jgi:hypothetical protein
MNVHPATAAIAAVLSLGLGFAAGTLPANSVGSPQIKNGQVTSADLKNGGVTTTDVKDGALKGSDFAAGAVPTAPIFASTLNTLGGCGGPGWCYLTTSGTGTTVASFDSAPPNSFGWTSTGTMHLDRASTVLFTANPTIWFFGTSNLDAVCSIKDGSTTLLLSGWVRSDGNRSRSLAINGVVDLAAGNHLITLNCRASGVDIAAANKANIEAVIIPQT